MELENEMEQEMQNELVTEETQNNFIQSTLGKTINSAVDAALRWVLPDLIEEQIIDVKDSLIQGGIKEGINTAIDSAINLGKSVMGIFTGKFENISQVQSAVEKGGLIDGVSNIIDSVLNSVSKSGILNSGITEMIRQGKNIILNNVSKNIGQEFTTQLDNLEKLGKYENNWKDYYESQDFEGMEREYKKIKDKLEELIPIENTLKEARNIENIHTLIKNNGQNFNLTEEELKLCETLT